MWKLTSYRFLDHHFISLILSLVVLCFSTQIFAAKDKALISNPEKIFARIDDLVISETEFLDIFRGAVRHKYYHGQVPESELVKFKKQVTKDIIIQILVHREAEKQDLEPNLDKILIGFNEFDQKYAGNLDWQDKREAIKPVLLKKLERQDLIEQMQLKIKSIENPGIGLIKEFYRKNPDKFTEPKRLWVSVILLSVLPSADKKMWSEADVAAQNFKKKIKNGEDFAALARKYSGHPSAVNGGDLGYLHQGMLEGDAQDAINTLKLNQVSVPVRVLEGVALFHMNGIQAEKHKPFDEVQQRVADLLYRELQDKAWELYTRKLTALSKIYINDELYVHNDEK